MQVPLQITLRNIPHSTAVEARVRQKALKLNSFSDKIISCHVVLEHSQAYKQHGQLYSVRILLSVPGRDLVANHNEHENLYMAIRDAFDDMTRQLEESTRMMKGTVKNHLPLLHGEIVRLFEDDRFGFIETPNGDEFYFNAANVVHPRFDRLEVGTQVHFIEKWGDDGPQAVRVSAKKSGHLGNTVAADAA